MLTKSKIHEAVRKELHRMAEHIKRNDDIADDVLKRKLTEQEIFSMLESALDDVTAEDEQAASRDNAYEAQREAREDQ